MERSKRAKRSLRLLTDIVLSIIERLRLKRVNRGESHDESQLE